MAIKVPDLKGFDIKALNRYFSPSALNELNGFIEKLPQNAGHTILIAAGVAWGFVGILGLFTTLKAQDLNNLRAQLQDAKALKPIVPVLSEAPIDQKITSDFVKKMADSYKQLEIRAQGNTITINASQTSTFTLFREAVIQVQNGAEDWKVGLDSLCVGRECKQNQLSISLKINRINIDKPSVDSVTYLPKSST